MELLKDYRMRTEGFMNESIPEWETFRTNEKLEPMKALLHRCIPELFAEPVLSETFHVTLHDLCNGTDRSLLTDREERNRVKSEEILGELMKIPPSDLFLRPVAAFNMVNTSIVLGFTPSAEADCEVLMKAHEAFQEVEYLNYPLTLHCTLAYFKPGEYDFPVIHRLNEALTEINRMLPETISLEKKRLCYQRFDSMNHYFSFS